jgi:hypothetical protein
MSGSAIEDIRATWGCRRVFSPGAAKLILIFRSRVKPKNQKYFAFAVRQISGLNLPVSPGKRGGSRSSRNARWDAVDVDVPTTNGTEAYGEVVWS